MNLAEVCFDTLPRIVVQRNERLSFRLAMLLHKATHRIVSALVTAPFTLTAIVAVFVPQPLENPHRRVTLLRRGRFIQLQNLKNPSLERSQLRSPLARPFRIRLRLGLPPQNLPNLRPRMMKTPSNLANAHPITMSTSDPSVIVHL